MEYSQPNERLKDKSKCANFRAQLKMCLLQTDCCKVHKITPRECLLSKHESVPEQCYILKNTFFECKRSIIDARRRFRGPKQ
ncbi:PREDICTED: cytochrome c oxidase assembly factor 5 [Ceratosolen solmsi marchali]|uniref:Cytochrome c oxidase assembly factor 5 n=1 Tax=Ceratosolen solmsi marchali TaxID=326594 RepID=A0AAJ6YTZ8_9HYME|nr:PREDICTED: cytochrome c oxidase assembly factor 5 [Ceratosolen solmsi marchali]